MRRSLPRVTSPERDIAGVYSEELLTKKHGPVRPSTLLQNHVGRDLSHQSGASWPILLTDPGASHKVDGPDHILQTAQAGIKCKTLININIEKNKEQVSG